MMNNTDNTAVRSIVLVDDDADFLHVMQRHLQSQRLEYAPTGSVDIHLFNDPVEALVNLPAEGICVIFLDYNMPQSTGVELLPKFLKAGVGPVILLTNQNDAKIAAEAFRAGASDYIAKTDAAIDQQRLARAIREAVHHYRLEDRNNQLTRQLKLMNIELEAKNKQLSELTETAHQFVDDVAHDFRTPLTVIEQYASIVTEGLSGPVTPKQVEHLELITEATHDLSEMVDDFLDSSKLRARALPVDRKRHTVQELFNAAAPMLAVRAAPKKIAIQNVIPENIEPFFGDLSKATRVLINLAVNAIKVSPDASTLRLWTELTEAHDIRIGITDLGPGLKSEDLKIIFDRFQQIGEPQIGAAKGFGLGLSIVKQLVWLNLGTIEVQSELGKGSTFAFTLPTFDLRRILTRYLDFVRSLEDVGDLWMLRIRSRNESLDFPTLRRLMSTSCYPRDLVLDDADAGTVAVLGLSRDHETWASRLLKLAAKCNPSAADLEVKPEGPWMRETDSVKLVETLLEYFSTRRIYA